MNWKKKNKKHLLSFNWKRRIKTFKKKSNNIKYFSKILHRDILRYDDEIPDSFISNFNKPFLLLMENRSDVLLLYSFWRTFFRILKDKIKLLSGILL